MGRQQTDILWKKGVISSLDFDWTGPLTTLFIQISWRADGGKIKRLIYRPEDAAAAATTIALAACSCKPQCADADVTRQHVVFEKSCNTSWLVCFTCPWTKSAGKDEEEEEEDEEDEEEEEDRARHCGLFYRAISVSCVIQRGLFFFFLFTQRH